MANFALPEFSDFDFKSIAEIISKSDKKALFVFSCGYEERSLSQYLEVKKKVPQGNINYLCFSFTTFKTSGSRQNNEATLSEDNIEPIELEPHDWQSAWSSLRAYISGNQQQGTHVFIDYSSMPRNWYCMLAKKMVEGEIGPNVTLIYSHGEYFESQYPCVGYGEFHQFSGRPNITSFRELNIFGLGFDSIRTHGIWTYLDPQLSVAVIAKSPTNEEHCERVRKENPEILSASESIHEVSIDQFSSMLSTLIDISRTYSVYGDIALVPDGPKPLVLAMSLVPSYLDVKGVYCWHVGHVKPNEYEPIDVKCSGEYFGFSIS